MTVLFAISILSNFILLGTIGALYARAKQRICDEKVATFGGCIAAIALGLLREDRQRGTDAIVEGLHRMRGGLDGEELKYRLVRAAACRLQRNDLAFDLIGETAHVAAPHIYRPTTESLKIADYIQSMDYSGGDPRELYGDQGLLLAEIQEEKAILDMYRASLPKAGLNPFKALMALS